MRQLTDLTDKAICWFNDIAEMCQKLTTGNVSHMGATIRGKAIRCAEYLNKHKEKPVSSIWHDAKEEPEISRKLFIICKTNRCTSYYVSIYNESSGKFCVNGRWYLLKDMTMWAYIDDLLEKQGEQKPVDKVEPKFHEDDWVVNKLGDVWHIDSFDKKNYQVSDGKGNYNYFPILKQDEMHLWTIQQDAKNGDVLADGNLPFIFKKIDANKYIYAYCGISVDDGFKIESDGESGEWTWMQDIKPATKEQRETLERAMINAGYTFDFEKKELKKIELSNKPKFKVGDTMRTLREADNGVAKNYAEYVDEHLHNRWKPSDEQMEALANALSLAKNCGEESSFDLRTLYEQLKKLREGQL